MTRKELKKYRFAIRTPLKILILPAIIWVFAIWYEMDHIFVTIGIGIFTIVCILKILFSKIIIGEDAIYFINFLNMIKTIPLGEITHMELKRDFWTRRSAFDEYVAIYTGNKKRWSLRETHPEYKFFIGILQSRGIELRDRSR